jgi:hypothetical protein
LQPAEAINPMKKILLSVFFLIAMVPLRSQYLAAYSDYLKNFWVFEAGTFQKVEYLEIQNYQVGGILVAYIDHRDNLKIYRNGEVKTLMQGSPIKYTATDYLLGYSLYQQLNVYDNGYIKVLSTDCDGFIVRDSLIAWHNQMKKTVQVYYNGRTITLIDGLLYFPVEEFKAGDNVIAFIHASTKQFYIFYLGRLQMLDDFTEDFVFETGRDIVAYMDIPDQSFNVFYRGTRTELETFKPKSFKVGDEILAYVDNLGKLKYFENGKVQIISSFEPQFYSVEDKVLVFEEQGYLKTVCNGKVYIVERYIPQPFKIDFTTIAYIDQSGFAKAFQNCEPISITFNKIKEVNLVRDLILFVEGINKTKIYFNGKVYENPGP